LNDTHSSEPAFILGLPRSGTTLLSYLLNTHPQVSVPPEPWLLLALEALGEVSPPNPADSVYLGQAFREFTAGCDLATAKRAFALDLYRQHLARSGKRVLIDKTPRYWLKLEQIRTTFPDARYIWLRRNPFAVLASMKTSWGFNLVRQLAGGGDHLHVFDLALGSRRLLEFAAHPPRHLLSVSYEDLVDDPVGETGRIFAFLGVAPFTIERRIDAGKTAAYAGSTLGDKRLLQSAAVNNSGTDAWRTNLVAEERNMLFDLLGPEAISDWGYADVAAELGRGRDQARQQQATRDLLGLVEGVFQARQMEMRRLAGPEHFDPATALAVRMAYRYPRQVLDALGLSGTKRS